MSLKNEPVSVEIESCAPSYVTHLGGPTGGSVVLGQGQSRKDTLHHAYKHFAGPDFEYVVFMTEVRLETK